MTWKNEIFEIARGNHTTSLRSANLGRSTWKVGAKGEKAADAADQKGNLQSIAGDWKGTVTLGDGRSVLASASFSDGSTGTTTLADPAGSVKYEWLSLMVSTDGTITAHTSEGANLIGKISQDGKQITGDIILASGTGHKISLSRR